MLAGCGYWARIRTVIPLLSRRPNLFNVIGITSLHPHTKDDGTIYATKREEFNAVTAEIAKAKPTAQPAEFFQDSTLLQALKWLKHHGRIPEGVPRCVWINTPNSGHWR